MRPRRLRSSSCNSARHSTRSIHEPPRAPLPTCRVDIGNACTQCVQRARGRVFSGNGRDQVHAACNFSENGQLTSPRPLISGLRFLLTTRRSLAWQQNHRCCGTAPKYFKYCCMAIVMVRDYYSTELDHWSMSPGSTGSLVNVAWVDLSLLRTFCCLGLTWLPFSLAERR